MNCDGCTLERDVGTLSAFRPDGLGETFYLCPLCRESVALSEAARFLCKKPCVES